MCATFRDMRKEVLLVVQVVLLKAVVKDMPIVRGIKKGIKDKEIMGTELYSAYYLAKREQPFTDFPDLLVLNEKMKCPCIRKGYRNDNAAALFTESIAKVSQNELLKDLASANFLLVPFDGSTDTSITEKELVYVPYFSDGTLTIRYLSTKDVKMADSISLQAVV